MFRFYAPLTLLPILLLTAALLLVRTQPYDNHELRQVLLPEDCPAPCFMGIHPGVTTADEALEILRASPWVEQVGYQFGTTIIRIKWKTNAPWWIADNGNGGSFIETVKGVVTKVRISGSLKLGDIQLMYGRTPLQYIIVSYQNGYAVFSYSRVYLNNGVMATIAKRCDDYTDHISNHDSVFLEYVLIKRESDLPRQYPNSWGDILRASCK